MPNIKLDKQSESELKHLLDNYDAKTLIAAIKQYGTHMRYIKSLARQEAIYSMYQSKKDYHSVALAFGVSTSRIRQIINHYERYLRHNQ